MQFLGTFIMNTRTISACPILYLIFISWLNAEPIVKISQGLLHGTTFESEGGRKFSAFIGIPFAETPIGPLRFSNPIPKTPWNGIRSANKEASICPQISEIGKVIGDEDCLYLNVYSPVLNFSSSLVNNTFNGKLLPAMVWIHDGAFLKGSGGPSHFGPNYLLDKDIVLVSINYRLAIFGFLSTGDSVAPGNFGLKDQVLALKWVQKNIRFFGGDPNRVTIFGCSAGGVSVNLHALSDASNGLFHQYIIQSGSVLAPWAYQKRSQFKPYVDQIAKKVGCSIINSTDVIKCLRETSVDKLLTTLISNVSNFPVLQWLPTDEPESEEAFLTDSPKKLVKQNKMKNYPVISGNVFDEGLVVTLPFYANLTSAPISQFVDTCINFTANHYLIFEDVPKSSEVVKDYYFNKKIISSHPKKVLESLTTFIGDSWFLYPQITVVDKLDKISENPVYYYLFNYRGQKNRKDKTVGVPHADELLYISSKVSASSLTKKDKYVIDLMIDLWTSFAINGKPTSRQLANPNIWQPYDENRNFLNIGFNLNNTSSSVTLQRDQFTKRMNFWKKHFPII